MTTFTLPASFDPAEFLTGRLQLRADDARWLVSTILRKTAAKDTDEWGCVRLDSMILSRVMGNQASAIVRALTEGGAIETVPHYPGVKHRGYRLAHRYLGDRARRVRAVDPWFLARLEKEQQRLDAEESRAAWLPIHYNLDREQHRLTIDRAADAIVDALPAHARLCQDVLVSRLRHRELPFTVSSTGRCFNCITGLKRELRAALPRFK